MNGSRSAYTRKRILEAALRLFAVKGDKTSLREITAEARVNVSAVNYHFGSKEGLIQAIYQHRVKALNQTLLKALDNLEEQARRGASIEARDLIEAYFRPLLLHALTDTGTEPRKEQASRDPLVLLRTLIMNGHVEVLHRFRIAFSKALPHIPEDELVWRLLFMLGAASCAVAGREGLIHALNPMYSEPFCIDSLVERLLSFLTGGFLAPLPGMPNAALSVMVESPQQFPGIAGP